MAFLPRAISFAAGNQLLLLRSHFRGDRLRLLPSTPLRERSL
ncbi:MAG: hypothetical protein RMX65_014075 [Nostoc sp. DedQUE01]|nr:hypothetical protein [Nostoc sp. DedQUE11]